MGMVPPRILRPRVIEEAINREVLFKTQEVADALAQAFGGMSLNEVRTKMDLPPQEAWNVALLRESTRSPLVPMDEVRPPQDDNPLWLKDSYGRPYSATWQQLREGYASLPPTDGLTPIILFGKTEPIAYVDNQTGQIYCLDDDKAPQYEDAIVAYEVC